ncbi:hypothetical protein KUTeg_014681 [Tegillarca granosa]|uniref:KCTD8/12/16 H1 domain-containing protein n=1 Tax=Tegillarca granosa TaxID=220873 RepID=A0ABQ9EW11_TEGGR|nr:hypothetical protein KUTeg_014681 [Tegillarca granosa]
MKQEAEYYQLPNLAKSLSLVTTPRLPHPKVPPITNSNSLSPVTAEGKTAGYITIGYRDVKFRKLSRIIICGKVSICREVFKDTLNESRDPDRAYLIDTLSGSF